MSQSHSAPLLSFHQIEAMRLAGNLRRDDPCPCGSGRKYEDCHLQRAFPTDAHIKLQGFVPPKLDERPAIIATDVKTEETPG